MLDFMGIRRFHPDIFEGTKRVEKAYEKSHIADFPIGGVYRDCVNHYNLRKPFFSPDDVIEAEDLESILTFVPVSNNQFQQEHNTNLVFDFDAEDKVQRALGVPFYLPRKPFRSLLDKDMKTLATIVGDFSGYDVADVLFSHQNVVDSDGNFLMVRGGLYGVPKGTEHKFQIKSLEDLTIQPEEVVLTPIRPLRMTSSYYPFYDGRKVMQRVYDKLE